MSGQWKGSDRRASLPKDWDRRRKRILRRDGYRCTEQTAAGRCEAVANQVDHVGDRDDHRDEMLRSLCQAHHDAKSSQQGVEARVARRNARLRPAPQHPSGLR